MSSPEVIFESGYRPIKLWIAGVPVEEQALAQLRNVAGLPFVGPHVAVMPDVHFGKGATIGSVIPTRGAIIPAAVGVDIGCGMLAVCTNLVASDLPDNLAGLRAAIERAVPHGRTNDGGTGDRGAWGDVPGPVSRAWVQSLGAEFKMIIDRTPALEPRRSPMHHLGTLGGGNHFIEICLDEAQAVWIMLHTGSRGVGNQIGRYFIERAKKDMAKWFVTLPDADLAYLPEGTDGFAAYVEAVGWAQRFAAESRWVMLGAVLQAVEGEVDHAVGFTDSVINCHHNYVQAERHFGDTYWITRKGAVRAGFGELGIIPGSMGAKSFIVCGKGNPESFNSCSHGAGRAMSRGEAKRRYSLADHEAATAGVECRKDADVIDETPAAYKDIDAVMAAQTDLVDVVHTLKQVLCVKG